MTAANPQRKISRPANPRPQPARRNAHVIAFDFVRKQRIAFDYDPNGNPISVTDNLSRTTLTSYDALNRPVRIVGPSYTDATYGLIRPVTKYVYDNLGNLTHESMGSDSIDIQWVKRYSATFAKSR